jgi:hypothetical protein
MMNLTLASVLGVNCITAWAVVPRNREEVEDDVPLSTKPKVSNFISKVVGLGVSKGALVKQLPVTSLVPAVDCAHLIARKTMCYHVDPKIFLSSKKDFITVVVLYHFCQKNNYHQPRHWRISLEKFSSTSHLVGGAVLP